MVDTLLLRPSLHFTQLHLTLLHYTCRHFTSSHLNFTQLHFTTLSFDLTPLHCTCWQFTSSRWNFTQLHFTTLSFGLNPFKAPTAPFHLTSLQFTSHHYTHLTSLHCTFRWFSPHFYSFNFSPFVIAFLNLFLKILGLQGKALTFSWLLVLVSKELIYREIIPDICSLFPVHIFSNKIYPTY